MMLAVSPGFRFRAVAVAAVLLAQALAATGALAQPPAAPTCSRPPSTATA